jgi:hypothetical protein
MTIYRNIKKYKKIKLWYDCLLLVGDLPLQEVEFMMLVNGQLGLDVAYKCYERLGGLDPSWHILI